MKVRGLTDYCYNHYDEMFKAFIIKYVNKDFMSPSEIDKMIDNFDQVLKYRNNVALKRSPEYKTFIRQCIYWKFKFLYTSVISSKPNYDYTMRINQYDLTEEEEEKIQEAYGYLKRAYKIGSTDAMAQYGYFYYTGEGIAKKRNVKKAVKFFQKATREETPITGYLYAEALRSKETRTRQTVKRVADIYEKALENKNLEARYRLADCYVLLEENLDRAEQLFRESEQGDYLARIEEVRRMQRGNTSR